MENKEIKFMRNFTHQWCDDSVAGVTGSDGVELRPSIEANRTAVTAILTSSPLGHANGELNTAIPNYIPDGCRPTDVLKCLPTTLAAIVAECGQSPDTKALAELDVAVQESLRNHAG